MAKMSITDPSLTPPIWAGDWLDRNSLIPGGAKVLAAAITADANGKKPVPNGTLLGRTFAERDAGTAFGLAVDTDDEFFIVAFDVTDALNNNDVELYRPGMLVKENFLPGWPGLSSALKAKVRAVYRTTKGVA